MKLTPKQLAELLTPSRERVNRMWTISHALPSEQYWAILNEFKESLQNLITSEYLEVPAGYEYYVDELLMLRIKRLEIS